MSLQGMIRMGMDTAAYALGFKRIEKGSKKAAKGIEDDMGKAARVSGAAIASGITVALGAALSVASQIAAKMEEAGRRTLEQTQSMGALLNLAKTPAEQQTLIDQQRGLRTTFGLPAQTALRTAFQLESQGVSGSLTQQAGQVAVTDPSRDPAAFVQGAGRFFKSQNITDPAEQSRFADLIFEAGLESEAGAPQIASAAALVGPALAGTGITNQALVTTLGAVGGKTPKEFATDLRTLIGSFTRLGLEKGSLLENADAFVAKFGRSGARALKAAGGTNALAALNLILNQRGAIKGSAERAGSITIGGRFEEALGRDEFAGPLATQIEQQRALVSEEDRAGGLEQSRLQVQARAEAAGGLGGFIAPAKAQAQRISGLSGESDAFDFTPNLKYGVFAGLAYMAQIASATVFGDDPPEVMSRAIRDGLTKPTTFNDNNQGGPNSGINTTTGPGL